MQILVDVSAGETIVSCLRAAGHDVQSIRDIDPRLPDVDILRLTVASQRLVLTMDKDFGELVVRSKEAHRGVLLLRLESVPVPDRARVVEFIFQQHADELPGNFCVFQNDRLRVRR